MKGNMVGGYRDADGVRHRLVVRRTDDLGWEVVDVDPTSARLVERLTDGVDGRAEAEAIARDYLTTAVHRDGGSGRGPRDAVPERGGARASNHRRPSRGARARQARAATLSGAAG